MYLEEHYALLKFLICAATVQDGTEGDFILALHSTNTGNTRFARWSSEKCQPNPRQNHKSPTTRTQADVFWSEISFSSSENCWQSLLTVP